MRLSRLFFNTLRDDPADAEVASHRLLVRAGYIRKLAGGIYTYMPLMWRVIEKVERIVREEMNAAGAQELRMPIMQPSDIWQESGRWDVYGKELIRLQDRHQRDMVLAPTHEEVITSLARSELHSYRQLPVNLYQIQNKYRDEVRPRFGLLRGREFIMKDAYSFHSSDEDLAREYDVMAEAYRRIFERCGLETKMIRSDSGAIGGSVSHEFVVLTKPTDSGQESGEVSLVHCECGYVANLNRAESMLPEANTTGDWDSAQTIGTPHADSIEALRERHNIRPETILKTLVYIADGKQPVLALVRGDCQVEDVKLLNALTAQNVLGQPVYELEMADGDAIAKLLPGLRKGFIGPVGELAKKLPIIADESVRQLKRFAVAVNEPGVHLVGAEWGNDVPEPKFWADIREARAGDLCPEDGQPLQFSRGIEVGNIFQLGTKYSEAMGAKYADTDGNEKPFIMGCYGIGVSRTAAAAVEQFHDANGIAWPLEIAPYQALVVPVNVNDALQAEMANRMYATLEKQGVEVLLDDRDERAGVKFKDADLMGIPLRLTIGKKATEGIVELKERHKPDVVEEVSEAQAIERVLSALQATQKTLATV